MRLLFFVYVIEISVCTHTTLFEPAVTKLTESDENRECQFTIVSNLGCKPSEIPRDFQVCRALSREERLALDQATGDRAKATWISFARTSKPQRHSSWHSL